MSSLRGAVGSATYSLVDPIEKRRCELELWFSIPQLSHGGGDNLAGARSWLVEDAAAAGWRELVPKVVTVPPEQRQAAAAVAFTVELDRESMAAAARQQVGESIAQRRAAAAAGGGGGGETVSLHDLQRRYLQNLA